MERPNKVNDDRQQETRKSNELIRTSKPLSLTSQTLNDDDDDQSFFSNDDQEQQTDVDIFLSKEICEAAEDLSFIANQMRSACHYEEVFYSTIDLNFVNQSVLII